MRNKMLKNTIEYKRFVWELKDVIDSNKGIKTKILFLCVGTNRIIGDAFGPVVGSVLKRNLLEENGINVLGDLKRCITYSDLNKMKNWLNMQKITL